MVTGLKTCVRARGCGKTTSASHHRERAALQGSRRANGSKIPRTTAARCSTHTYVSQVAEKPRACARPWKSGPSRAASELLCAPSHWCVIGITSSPLLSRSKRLTPRNPHTRAVFAGGL